MKICLWLFLLACSFAQAGDTPETLEMKESQVHMLVDPNNSSRAEVCCLGCVCCCCCLPVVCLCMIGEKYAAPIKQKVTDALGLTEQKVHQQ